MIDSRTFADLATLDLGPFGPKPTALSEGQVEAAKTLWKSEDGLMEVGVWECTPGRFTASRERNSETCHIVSGRVSLHDAGGQTREVRAGEALVLPKGWKGEWTIHETTRKLYIMHYDAA